MIQALAHHTPQHTIELNALTVIVVVALIVAISLALLTISKSASKK